MPLWKKEKGLFDKETAEVNKKWVGAWTHMRCAPEVTGPGVSKIVDMRMKTEVNSVYMKPQEDGPIYNTIFCELYNVIVRSLGGEAADMEITSMGDVQRVLKLTTSCKYLQVIVVSADN